MFAKNKSILSSKEKALSYEWLETNGLGGWSSSTIIGCNTRRYHGLLVAATNSPAERFSLLSKMDETIILNGERYDLGISQFSGDVFDPMGNKWLELFERNIFPEWTYRVEDISLKKTIAMINGENSIVIRYDLIKSVQPILLEFLPLLSARGYHLLQKSTTNFWWDIDFHDGIFSNQPFEGSPRFYISIPGSSYSHRPQWYYNFYYQQEKERGLDFEEDLFNLGKFLVAMQEGESLAIIVSTQHPANRDAYAMVAKEKVRRQSMLIGCPDDVTAKQLTLAADQFVVKRGSDLRTVIAGYHWFTDWARDTMIALPGLCLSTGRFEDAKNILKEFASVVSMGMLPNRFREDGGMEYNNADGTLWYFVAIYKYLKASGDKIFVLEDLLPVLRDIMEWHEWGTRFNIHVEDDGLLYAGEPGTQLTWMDAKVGDWVVTPRKGKPVEVNALWYNAQKIFAELLALNGELEEAAAAETSAGRTCESFVHAFWNDQLGYCYDVIDEGNKDASVRPNAIFSISLPFSLFSNEKAISILNLVKERLYTPLGLRSLDPADPNYKSNYAGNQLQRDGAYHQGTVWTWLLGPYVDALLKVKGERAHAEALRIVQAFRYHLADAGIGTVSEVAVGNQPFDPKGCIAQAWGVGEWLRIIRDFELYKVQSK